MGVTNILVAGAIAALPSFGNTEDSALTVAAEDFGGMQLVALRNGGSSKGWTAEIDHPDGAKSFLFKEVYAKGIAHQFTDPELADQIVPLLSRLEFMDNSERYFGEIGCTDDINLVSIELQDDGKFNASFAAELCYEQRDGSIGTQSVKMYFDAATLEDGIGDNVLGTAYAEEIKHALDHLDNTYGMGK